MKDLATLEVFWILLAGVLILSSAVYFFERKHNPDFPKGRKEGVAEALYYVMAMTLTGKSVYKGFPGVLGRMVLMLWVFAGSHHGCLCDIQHHQCHDGGKTLKLH